jgi:DNA polymerase III subunit delta'
MSWDMIGHEWAVNLLTEHIVQGKLRHAYLFTGPAGVGRRTLALRLSQAVNCLQPPSPGKPCRSCRACNSIENMIHPDLAVVQVEEENRYIRIHQIREVHHSLSLAPYEARFRIALFLRFEDASNEAANALLKTLEEPPPQVILMLTAESGERLLPTIVSRCEVIRLRSIPVDVVSQGLINHYGVPPDQAQLLAHLSGGRPGQAIHWHLKPEQLEQRQAFIEDLTNLLKAGRLERFAYVQSLTKDKEKLNLVLNIWISFWRDVLLRAAGASTPLTNLDWMEEIEILAQQLSLERSRLMLSKLERTFDLIERNINIRLAAEVLMLDLPRL